MARLETVLMGLKEAPALAKLSASTAVMAVVPAFSAYAAAADGLPAGESLLTGDLLTSVQSGIANIQATGIQVVGLVVVAGIALVGVSAAANFVIKKVKGILSKAG